MSLNERLFLSINRLSHHSLFLDGIMVFCARYGPFLLAGFLIYLWFFVAETGRKAAVRATVGGALSIAAARIVGLLHYQAIPSVLGLGRPLVLHAANNSFPSDHASFSFGLAMSLLFSGSVLWPEAVTLAALIAFARVFVGVHFPLDVVVGFVVGTFVAALVHRVRVRVDLASDFVYRLQVRILSAITRRER